MTYLDVDADGMVNADQLKEALTPDTILVSIMAANNEIGTCSRSRRRAHCEGRLQAAFHVDAVQAVGAIEVNLEVEGSICCAVGP